MFELSPQAHAWLVERLRAELPAFARWLSGAQASDLIVVGRREEFCGEGASAASVAQ